jgi:hypothetical protein
MKEYGRLGRIKTVIPKTAEIPLITKLYDNLGNLLVECLNWVIHIRQTEIEADTDLSLMINTDLNLETGGDFNHNIGNDENHSIDNDYNCTATENVNIGTSNADINLTSGNDVNVSANGAVNVSCSNGLYLGGLKAGTSQAAAGAAAGELWVNTTAAPYTICIGV